jgi:hypothetical protein
MNEHELMKLKFDGGWYYMQMYDGTFVVGYLLDMKTGVFGIIYSVVCADDKTIVDVDPEEIESVMQLI